jgi:exopolysaccharide production protein ExoZ
MDASVAAGPGRTTTLGVSKGASRELLGVQYLRGFAALLVVAFHATLLIGDPALLGRPGPGLLAWGYLGVDLFFVISGFIITYTALDPATGAASMAWRSFAWRRFLRIVPFMWFCVLGYLALRLLGRGLDAPFASYLRALVLWPVGELKPDVIWTLRHEALFYAVFALTFLGPPRLRPLFVVWALSPLLLHAVRPIGTVESEQDLLEFIANPVNVQFGMGVLAGLCLIRVRRGAPVVGFRAFSDWRGFVVIGVSSLVLLAIGQAFSLAIMTVRGTLIAGAVASIMLALAIIVPSPAGDGMGPVARFGRLVGDASYAIYLTHVPVLVVVIGGLAKLAPNSGWGLAMAVATLGSIVVGIVVHGLVERPLLRALRARHRVSQG